MDAKIRRTDPTADHPDRDAGNSGSSQPVLALEDKFINVTLKKTVDWVELNIDQSQVSNPSTGAGTGV